MIASLDPVGNATERWLDAARGPLVLGICGAQGSGKSTLADALVSRFAAAGIRAATLSLDDLYLGRAARAELARDVHPLFATRGVPLTHDAASGCAILDAVRAGTPVQLPRFDKASDAPLPREAWEAVDALDLLIFEGWCVGARPQADVALADPVNRLEQDEDPDGIWRRAVNAALAGPYRALFDRIDRLVLLAAPDFSVVRRWRGEQEAALRARLRREGRDPAETMDDAALDRFVEHYERITRSILTEMPARADLTLRLDAQRAIIT
ncbi:kinase [Sphingomonas suaedae]|uniref:Kinase n=1 Tax=Sphingomonas suaedae TaxID=2599297 RepID=A0A518RAZ8_9SPHN|nr:kinase [Sphingomonas suaedae]